MANKTVVVEKEKKHTAKTHSVDEAAQTAEPIGESAISKPAEIDENAPTNSVGQRIDSEITDGNKAYVTPDGRIMIVQMEEEDQVFAGEHGRNAQWYPKDVVKSWTKKAK